MSIALALAGLALGAAASPHCAAMCGAPCAAVTGGCKRRAGGFQLGRLLGYMGGGALAATSVQALGVWSQWAPALKPFWTLVHLALLALGLWWLATGRPLDWMSRSAVMPVPVRIVRRGRPLLRAGLAGLGWIAWPCGALQAALLLAALADNAIGGAFVMAAFAIGSMPALLATPVIWRLLGAIGEVGDHGEGGNGGNGGARLAIGYRIAGASLVMASAWAVGHGLWVKALAWCFG